MWGRAIDFETLDVHETSAVVPGSIVLRVGRWNEFCAPLPDRDESNACVRLAACDGFDTPFVDSRSHEDRRVRLGCFCRTRDGPERMAFTPVGGVRAVRRNVVPSGALPWSSFARSFRTLL